MLEFSEFTFISIVALNAYYLEIRSGWSLQSFRQSRMEGGNLPVWHQIDVSLSVDMTSSQVGSWEGDSTILTVIAGDMSQEFSAFDSVFYLVGTKCSSLLFSLLCFTSSARESSFPEIKTNDVISAAFLFCQYFRNVPESQNSYVSSACSQASMPPFAT